MKKRVIYKTALIGLMGITLATSNPSTTLTANAAISTSITLKPSTVYNSNTVWLQKNLTRLGYDTKGFDGKYGTNTTNAVIAFQNEKQLNPDGIAGPKTISALNAECEKLQRALNDKFGARLSVDGLLGDLTMDKVVEAKKKMNYSNSTRIADKAFRTDLYKFSLSVNSSMTPHVVTYSAARNGSAYITKNFQIKEFRCSDGTDKILIDVNLVNKLQMIRDHFGKAIIVTCGYRTPARNVQIPNAASNSQHLYGRAIDFKFAEASLNSNAAFVRQVAQYAASIGIPGVELQLNSNNTLHHLHIDSRTNGSYWWIVRPSGTVVMRTPADFLKK